MRSAVDGYAIVGPAERVIVATAVPAVDPTLVTGTGLAGGVVSPEDLDQLTEEQENEGREIIAATVDALGELTVEGRVLRGEAGPELCVLAEQEGASVIVVGSRGHGAIKRALLGSVSHHLVHNAPCPVLVMRSTAQDDD